MRWCWVKSFLSDTQFLGRIMNFIICYRIIVIFKHICVIIRLLILKCDSCFKRTVITEHNFKHNFKSLKIIMFFLLTLKWKKCKIKKKTPKETQTNKHTHTKPNKQTSVLSVIWIQTWHTYWLTYDWRILILIDRIWFIKLFLISNISCPKNMYL